MNDQYRSVVILIIFISCGFGWLVGTILSREEAIRAGVAEYVVDPKTGETTFQFKKP